MQKDKMTPPIPETSTETSTDTSSSSKEEHDDGLIPDADFYNQDFEEILDCFNKNIHTAADMEKQRLESWLGILPKECVLYCHRSCSNEQCQEHELYKQSAQ